MNSAPEIMRKVKGQGQWSIYHRVPMQYQILPPKQDSLPLVWSSLGYHSPLV